MSRRAMGSGRRTVAGGACAAAVLLAMVWAAAAAVSFPAHRVLQYEAGGQQRGCHRTAVNNPAAAYAPDAAAPAARSMMVYSHADVMSVVAAMDAGAMDDGEFQAALSGGTSGVLIILPAEGSDAEPRTAEQKAAWRAVEEQLLAHKLALPVYFARDTADTHALMESLAGARLSSSAAAPSLFDMLLGDTHQLVVSGREGTAIKKPSLTNIYGWLSASAESLPVIMVVANYDALSAAPTLSHGAGASGSGMLGAMQLARAFAKMQRTYGAHWRYNMLFVLADGGALNHAGVEAWLAEADARLVSSVELVVYLDDLTAGSAEPLYMHASRPRKNPLPQRLYNAWEAKSESAGRQMAVNIQKVNVSAEAVRYPHEHFSKKRVFAVTVSSRNPPPRDGPPLPGSGATVFESRGALDASQVLATANAVGDVLLAYMFPDTVQASMPVLAGEVPSAAEYAEAFADAFVGVPRPPLVLQNRTVVEELRKAMESVLVDVVAHEVASARLPFTLYKMAEVEMHAYVVKPYVLDVVLALAILAYLALLYVGLRGGAAWKEFLGVVAAVRSGGAKAKRA